MLRQEYCMFEASLGYMVRHPSPQCLKTLSSKHSASQWWCINWGSWVAYSIQDHSPGPQDPERSLIPLAEFLQQEWPSLQGPSPSISSWPLVEGLSSYIIPGGATWWGRSLNVQKMWVSEACCHSVPIQSLHLLANSPFPSWKVV